MRINKCVVVIKASSLALVLYGVLVPSLNYAAVAVGDLYEGGTVFCVSQTPDLTQCVTQGAGNYGLIMANEDQVNFDSNSQHGVQWFTKYLETKAASADDGAANTAAIIAALPQDNPSNNAAWLCHNYRGGGQEDWYLPAINELNKIYLYARAQNLIGRDCAGRKPNGVQCLVGGYDEQYKRYWSSTEDSRNIYAWFQSFSDGARSFNSKFSSYFGVRAVRAFGISGNQQFSYAPTLRNPLGLGLAVPEVPLPRAAASFQSL